MCHNSLWLLMLIHKVVVILVIRDILGPSLLFTTAGHALGTRGTTDVLHTAVCLVITCVRPLGSIMKRSFLFGEFLTMLSGTYWPSVPSWRRSHCMWNFIKASREMEFTVAWSLGSTILQLWMRLFDLLLEVCHYSVTAEDAFCLLVMFILCPGSVPFWTHYKAGRQLNGQKICSVCLFQTFP